METREVAITTEDNPYNPFTEFDSWVSFDVVNGYYTCENLAKKVNNLPKSLSDAENTFFVEQAIDEMIKHKAIGKNGKFVNYKKVYKDSNE